MVHRRHKRGFQQLGGSGMGKLAACYEIDHLGKAEAADQLLDRVAAIPDHPGLHLDDRCRPPILRGVVACWRAAIHVAPSRASSSISRLANPSSPRSSHVSLPRAGGGEAGSGSPLARRKPDRTTRTGRSTPDTEPKVLSSPRSITCGCSSTAGRSRTSPAGTPFLLRSADHACADLAASARSISTFNSNRRRLRSSRPIKRGSEMSSSRPINRHSVSNCSCLLASMFRFPSPVRYVPYGLAVMFS